MSLTLIAAMDRRRAIGRGNQMPWHLPRDLQRFKALTLGHPVLMGRKTAASIGRALPGRLNLVLTRGPTAPFAEQQVVATLSAAMQAHPDLWVIGGGEIYALALPLATALKLTLVDTEISDADVFFPPFEALGFVEQSRTHAAADSANAYAMDFVDYVRAG